MAQVQCPNCGGYNVSTTVIEVNRRTGEKVEVAGCGCWAVALFGIFIAIMSLGGGIANMDDHQIVAGLGGICFGLFIVGLIFWGMVLRYKNYYKADKIIKYKHECLLCGYRWERREDEPLPEVHVRPDLIAAGDRLRRQAGSCKVCGYHVGENVRTCPYCGAARW